jgi:hypothetical protein
MNKAFLFKWGADTFIMKANWEEANAPIMVNGCHIKGNVGHYEHDPKKVARTILEKCAADDGLCLLDTETKKIIDKALKNM